MLNRQTIEDVFELYDDELSLVTDPILKNTLLIYLIYQGEDYSYTYNGLPLNVYYDNPATSSIKNALLICEDKVCDEKCFSEIVTAFLNNSIGSSESAWKVYINPEERVAQIMGKYENYYQISRIIPAIITRIMPWLFENLDKKIRDQVAEALISPNASGFDELIEKLLRDKGIINKILESKLEKMGSTIIEAQIQQLRSDITDMNEKIKMYTSEIGRLTNEIMDYQIIINGYENSKELIESPISEISDFIKMSPEDIQIHYVDVDSSKLQLLFRTQLDQFEDDAYAANIEQESYLYARFMSKGYKYKDIHKMFKMILKDNDYKIWCKSLIEIDLNRPSLYAREINDNEVGNSMKHPHLNEELSCFGTAAGVIVEYLSKFRFAEALMQLTYASKQITLYDGAAGSRFIDGITKRKCIECPDGEFRTAIEILDDIAKEEDDNVECND